MTIYGVDGGALSIHTDETRSTLQCTFIYRCIYICHTVHAVSGEVLEFIHAIHRHKENNKERKEGMAGGRNV